MDTQHLQKCIDREIITMSQLHAIIVFDGGKVMRANADFANTIKRIYAARDTGPRILALCSTSEIADVHRLAELLEAEAVSSTTTESLPCSGLRPAEVIVRYDPALAVRDTQLTEQVRLLAVDESVFRSMFMAACDVLKALGSCASDHVWRRAVRGTLPVIEKGWDTEAMTEDLVQFQSLIGNWIFSVPNADRSSKSCNVTPKFAKLIQLLTAAEPWGAKFRGIIFGRHLLTYVVQP